MLISISILYDLIQPGVVMLYLVDRLYLIVLVTLPSKNSSIEVMADL